MTFIRSPSVWRDVLVFLKILEEAAFEDDHKPPLWGTFSVDEAICEKSRGAVVRR